MIHARGVLIALLLTISPGCGEDSPGSKADGDQGGEADGAEAGEDGGGPGGGGADAGGGAGGGQGGEGGAADGGAGDAGDAEDGGRPDRPVSPWAPVVGLSGKVVTSVRVLDTKPATVWASTRRNGLWKAQLGIDAEFERVPTPDSDVADVLVVGDEITILLEDDGPWRSTDEGRSWRPLRGGWTIPALPIDLASDRPLGRRLVSTTAGLFGVATGGIFKLDGETWTNVSLAGGMLNPVAEALHEDSDGTLYAGASSLVSFAPPELASVVNRVIYRSEDAGASWQPFDEGVPASHVTGFASADGELFAATNGGGVIRLDREAGVWTALDTEDLNILGIWTIPEGGLLYAGANGWAEVSINGGERWYDVTGGLQDFPPAISGAFVPDEDGHMLFGVAGEGVWATEDVVAAPPAQRSDREVIADGKVEIVLSFHVNLYHSYRGDSNDEDGFGKDIRVIGGILDMLDAHPHVKADWDIDNAFSLDNLLPRHAPDLLDRIVERVTKPDGQRDGLRLMSWNNGMAGAMTAEELRESLLRAKDSYRLTFGNVLDPGIQPQENMFSPDHLDVLTQEDLGIEWITLFYSATNFTGFRRDALLTLEQAHNVLSLKRSVNEDDSAGLKLLPVYHHADVIDHGGLLSWARQLHRELPNKDALIAVHFDADAESWLGFENELVSLQESGEEFIKYTTLQDYYRRHSARPAGNVVLARDLADGAHDGWASWAEKWINREVFTPIERARMKDSAAFELLRKVERADRRPVLDAREQAMTDRLKALSSTHFGLANPALHPDREAAALRLAAAAESSADEALQLAVARIPEAQRPPGGEFWLFHPSGDAFSGVARVEVSFKRGEHSDPEALTARLHRLGDDDELGSRAPGQLITWGTFDDGSVELGEFWLNADLGQGELVGLSFETPERAPEFGDDVTTERLRVLQDGHADVRFDGDGKPIEARAYLDERTYIPIGAPDGRGDWWQPFITWDGVRYSPDRYDIDDADDGWRGYTAAKQITASVPVPGGGSWDVAYTFRTVKDLRGFLLEVETTYPGEAGDPDPRLTEAVPVGMFPWIFERELFDHDNDDETPMRWNRDWVERHVVWRETFRGNWSGFPVQEHRDTINSASAMGWGAVFTTMVAFDRWERSSPAFMPLRFQGGQGLDLRMLLAPFGTLDGDPPDPRPERTRGSGVGARLTRMASHQGPAAPAQAGRTERFTLWLGPVPAVLGGDLSGRPSTGDISVARAWATRPVVLTPPGL